MPYSIEWDKKVVRCTFSGNVSGKELIDCNMSIYGNPNFDDIRLRIFDMLNVTEISFNRDDVIIVAAYDRAATKVNPRVKCALVSADQVFYKLSDVYQNENVDSPWESKAFHTLSEALEWGCPY